MNNDSNSSTLSFEVVKVMLDNSMAHSLLQALKRISLQHPLATSVAAALLRPMEVFTRPMVVDKIQDMLDKERLKVTIEGGQRNCKSAKTLDSNVRHLVEPSQHNESAFADDEMLEDGFDIDTAERTRNTAERRRRRDQIEYEQMSVDDIVEEDEESFSEDEENEDDDDIDENSSDELEDESDDESSSSIDDSSDDDELSDDHSMSESQVDTNEETESISEDIEEGDLEFLEEHLEVLDDENDFEEEEEHDDFFEGNSGIEQDDEADGNNSMEEDTEEWTNVEMMMSRNNGRSVGRPRSGRFVLEAAEAVIGNILRTGDIHMETIAEIENTLGIRISNRSEYQHNRHVTPQSQSNSNMAQGLGSDPVDEIPRVNQVSLEQGNWSSSVGISNRHFNFYSMGNFFEGSALGADRLYFDVTGITSENEQSNPLNAYPIPSTFDLQLFPGGPAAATHSRMPTAPHPLLSGITLPPVNALVSVRALQEDRARGFGHSSHGVLTNLRGSGIRQYRSPTINIFERLPTSPQGNREFSNWTADGQPLARTSTDFSQGFEQILGGVISYSAPSSQDNHNQQNSPSNQMASAPAENEDEDMDMDEVEAENTTTQQASQRMREENEGDVHEVASTLTQGLTLVNRNEDIPSSSGTSDATPTEDSNSNREMGSHPDSTSNAEVEGPQNDNSIMASELETAVALHSEPSIVEPNTNGLSCPPGMDIEVFNQLPVEMQQEIADQHQATQAMAAQLDSSSGLDPETLAALPEDVRREVIEQDQRERRLREQEQAPADPSNAQDMDNASFIASLAPGLREDVLMNADEDFLNSLPPDIIAEARLLSERATSFHRRGGDASRVLHDNHPASNNNNAVRGTSTKRKVKTGKLRVDCDRTLITFDPIHRESDNGQLITASSSKDLMRLMYLLSPVRPTKLLQKLFQNLCRHPQLRKAYLSAFVALLDNDPYSANRHLDDINNNFDAAIKIPTNKGDTEFPPSTLIGTAPDISEGVSNRSNFASFGKKDTDNAPASIAANLPISGKGPVLNGGVPPVVARRLIQMISFLSKTPSRVAIDLLNNLDQGGRVPSPNAPPTCFETLLGLLESPIYTQSSANLDDILNLMESLCAPLSSISNESDDDTDTGKNDGESAVTNGKEWIEVPKTVVSPEKLKLLCSTLRLESCKDASIQKVHTIIKRLCKVNKNRVFILSELASVAQALASDAVHDLRSLSVRLRNAVEVNKNQEDKKEYDKLESANLHSRQQLPNGAPSSAVTLFASSSEGRLLCVLQTLFSLVGEAFEDSSKPEETEVNVELSNHVQHISFDSLWEQLSSCLKSVSILEGVAIEDEVRVNDRNDKKGDEEQNSIKLQSNVAGLLPRFLPSIEAFFVVNANHTKDNESVISTKVVNFVTDNRILLNALLRSNPSLLDRGLKAMVQIPQCRPFLDFDVKRQWFKTQVKKIRTNRRHGSLKLRIRRRHVFEDAYHQLRLRNAEEMRGRLQITFVNEEGVDAGGLSREFFGILAKEMFNPNYALFLSSEESMYTFQPNPQSRINPDHLEYFRFVGKIVGKAIVDGYLLDAVRTTCFFFRSTF
jgi:hypothetical protein